MTIDFMPTARLPVITAFGPGRLTVPILATMGVLLMCLIFASAHAQTRQRPSAGAGQGSSEQTFKDWTARCESPEQGGSKRCYISQIVSLRENNQNLLAVAVGYPEKGRPAAAIFKLTLDLGLTIGRGVSFAIDKGETVTVPYQLCFPDGCQAVLPLEDSKITQMKKGSQGRLGFYDAMGRQVVVPISLSGFTAGINSLKK